MLYFIPERSANVSGEQAVYDGIGGRIQRRQALYESCEGHARLRFWYVAVHLQQVEHYVRAPAQDEY